MDQSKNCDNSKGEFLHNVIMNHKPDKITVDHINRNGHDNRKANLRLATKSEQCLNRKKLVITKIHTSNKLGVKNIHETVHHDQKLIICEFTKDDRKFRKQFSVSKHTKEGAIRLAEQWRDAHF